MFASLRRKKSKKEVLSEAKSRSFGDPARQIFHDLRVGVVSDRVTPTVAVRGSVSLEASPIIPRRHTKSQSVSSLQNSTGSDRRSSPLTLLQEAAAAAAPLADRVQETDAEPAPSQRDDDHHPLADLASSPADPRLHFCVSSTALETNEADKRVQTSECEVAGNGEGWDEETSEVRQQEGCATSHVSHHRVTNNSDAAAGQKQATLGSRNTQSATRQQRLMAGHGVSGGGLVGVAPSSSSSSSAGGSHSGKGPRMDVVYVTERIISLSFPADVDDATYRLHLREVARMLASKHGDNFKVFNLSHHGELSRFLPRVSELGWPEQLAPALERLCSICKALDSWVNQHNLHVAVLHARGGYEKLGVVVAAYMHYSNICASTDQALDRYAMKRFFDDKIGQLYHPSQKRYVQYFAGLLSGVIRINSSPLYLHTLTLYGIPHFEARGGCHLFVKIYQGMTPLHTTGVYNLTDTMRQVTITFEGGVQLRGDILLKAYHRRLVPASREIIFRIQFHTCAVSEKLLSFTKHDLDDACNDMRFPSDGGVELYFSNSGDDRPRTTASTVSCDTSPCAITAWDSYKDLDLSHEHHEQGAGITGSSRSGQQGVSSSSSSGGVSYTLGPLDGSLYATVTKKKAAAALASPPGSSSSGSGPQAISGPHAPSPTVSSPSPNTLVNGRHAASLDSGIASSNSAVVAVPPVSPPTSDSSRASAESRGIGAPKQSAATAAAVVAPAPHVDASQLDELLHGMLLDIENIPDLRPCQTPAPDIDSIRCPDFSNMAPKLESRSTSRSGGSDLTQLYQHYSTTTTTASSSDNYGPTSPVPTTTHSPINSFSISTTHDSLLDSSLNTTSEDMPYHARSDSKPFSYGGFTSSPMLGGRLRSTSESGVGDVTPAPPPQQQQPPQSPSIHRRNSRETLGTQRSGLESPRLVRRMSGSIGANSPLEGSGRRSPSLSPSPEPCGSRGGTLQRQRSHTLTSRIMAGHGDTTPTSTLNRSDMTRSASRLDDSLDLSFSPEPLNCSAGSSSNLSWLQIQQRKLQERREAKMRAERAPQEARVLSELRTRMTQQQRTTSSSTMGREGEDGYVSDTTLLSETSRESSPIKALPPLTINTSSATPQKPPIGHSTPARGNSAPSSPILSTRSSLSKEHSLIRQQAQEKNSVSSTMSTTLTTAAATSSIPRSGSLSRKGSDTDRERPFMAVKRAHEHAKPGDISDSATALSQLQTSPLGHINYSTYNTSSTSEGLLTTVQSSSTPDQQSREENTWQSDTEGSVGGTRPITPGFPPATPTTPYLNQGLPPKSPTMQRKDMGGVRSPSPAVSSQHVSSSNRQQEVNGHASPAPSLYHSQSRRSSLTSLTDTMEVISSHPKFVKDISKFWYKPSITRDEAISTLRDKPPGTFVVRDSNSFPGAFGLALKVATPPLNVANKSGDPANELVRHFLIEPTSRGVRLKGCSNEPVFGSLSALVYQHSITALALPCRLVMPERDPSAPPVDTIDSSSSLGTSSTTQLLQQGAACSVLYLYSADMESLTGPQAIKRGVTLLLGAKNITATIVHFKVSAQGITMTDNERKLFFRRHYPVNTISHCGLDPDDRRWAQKNDEGAPVGSLRLFGFVAKKGASRTDNLCHVLAELEPEQPATAIVNFVTKVMMTSVSRPNLV